ncbi:tRNA (adenosine(37)-N6)-threonylcarbamoyltransferase complex dimerization subunit type 1 TsaB [Aurantiacibacter aquimixticola]|uniref:tRNA (Adenosine(37)-N6)-threonylcarbamoyltransferase complex dimerization subunit type 1 TsaB n=1 Tax=Aurantiacibacter aquimixticola TaxID=1958945 RepID=A0A419RQL4_9SPHN|nr:tRNA (adenosine(37)-N6)-threonylcarbamoyltransferase complex dimerization subunit type 1 TsaB [Aurantiacibacter aquimixticola]RJY08057.1 tRNA (adenosine(37)-N6)-threonylcarbamoyltransferase complex dimerization subunit type 1 TsaB [Aurantiacibacter aquimixticola]
MRVLAIDCATEACSAALFEDEMLLDGRWEILGRGHAERLVPMIAELPRRGRADRILVSLGPGSFTGTRIGIAAARALGLAWGAQVLGYPTLALVAAMAQAKRPGPVTVCMSGGHGEYFVQDFAENGFPAGNVQSLAPADAAARGGNETIAGSKADALDAMLSTSHDALHILPDAREAGNLPPSLAIADLKPIYGRAPDARKPAAP